MCNFCCKFAGDFILLACDKYIVNFLKNNLYV